MFETVVNFLVFRKRAGRVQVLDGTKLPCILALEHFPVAAFAQRWFPLEDRHVALVDFVLLEGRRFAAPSTVPAILLGQQVQCLVHALVRLFGNAQQQVLFRLHQVVPRLDHFEDKALTLCDGFRAFDHVCQGIQPLVDVSVQRGRHVTPALHRQVAYKRADVCQVGDRRVHLVVNLHDDVGLFQELVVLRHGVRGQIQLHQFERQSNIVVRLVELALKLARFEDAPELAPFGMFVHDDLHAPQTGAEVLQATHLVSLGPTVCRIFPGTRGQRLRERLAPLGHFGAIFLVVLRRVGDAFHVLQRFDNVPEDRDGFGETHHRLQRGFVWDQGCQGCHDVRCRVESLFLWWVFVGVVVRAEVGQAGREARRKGRSFEKTTCTGCLPQYVSEPRTTTPVPCRPRRTNEGTKEETNSLNSPSPTRGASYSRIHHTSYITTLRTSTPSIHATTLVRSYTWRHARCGCGSLAPLPHHTIGTPLEQDRHTGTASEDGRHDGRGLTRAASIPTQYILNISLLPQLTLPQ